MKAPERFDVLEFLPGEEAQVDYGQGALTLTAGGKYKKPYLFVMTLKYSGKSFRKVVWKTSQEVWAQLHEEAFRSCLLYTSVSPPSDPVDRVVRFASSSAILFTAERCVPVTRAISRWDTPRAAKIFIAVIRSLLKTFTFCPLYGC